MCWFNIISPHPKILRDVTHQKPSSHHHLCLSLPAPLRPGPSPPSAVLRCRRFCGSACSICPLLTLALLNHGLSFSIEEGDPNTREGYPIVIWRSYGGYRVTAMQMPVPLNYVESTSLPSSTFSSTRLVVALDLSKTAFGYDKMLFPRLCSFCLAESSIVNFRRTCWSLRSMADDSRPNPPESNVNGGTRLIRAFQSFQTKLRTRIEELKKGLSMKVLFFLVGFYCATAFATVIGQTGDWDILSAGLAVVVVEGIGALMYTASFRLFDKTRSLITLFNYWKAGLSLGLFLDAFKY